MKYSFNSHNAASVQQAIYRQFADIFQKTFELAFKAPSMEQLQEITDLNEAYKTKAIALQKIWMQDWSELLDGSKSLFSLQDVSNPTSNFDNLINKSEHQIIKQMEEYAEFLESAASGYSFWLARQIQSDSVNS